VRDLLYTELAEGRSFIGLMANEVVRNAFVVALCLHPSASNTDEPAERRFLVKIGEVLKDSRKVVACCLLPGLKRMCRETHMAAATRLLENDLGQIAEHIDLQLCEGGKQTVSLQTSPTYGIRTRYVRMTFTATLNEDARLDYLSAPRVRNSTQDSRFRRPLGWLWRPEKGSKVQAQAAEILASHANAVALSCAKENRASRKLYLWLNQEEFEVLQNQMATPVIHSWLQTLTEEDTVGRSSLSFNSVRNSLRSGLADTVESVTVASSALTMRRSL